MKVIILLNETIGLRGDRLVYKADAKHAKTIIEGISLLSGLNSV